MQGPQVISVDAWARLDEMARYNLVLHIGETDDYWPVGGADSVDYTKALPPDYGGGPGRAYPPTEVDIYPPRRLDWRWLVFGLGLLALSRS